MVLPRCRSHVLPMTDDTLSRRRFFSLGLAAAFAVAAPPVLGLGGPVAAEEEATTSTRYYFSRPGVRRQLSPTIRRDLRQPSTTGGNSLLLNNPNKRASGVERSQAERFKRRSGQAIRRLERVPGGRDNRIDRRIRTLRGEQRRISRSLRDAR